MYTADSGERMPPNIDGLLGGLTNWVAGHMSVTSESKNSALFVDERISLLSAYLMEPTVYKCPVESIFFYSSYVTSHSPP